MRVLFLGVMSASGLVCALAASALCVNDLYKGEDVWVSWGLLLINVVCICINSRILWRVMEGKE